MARESFIIRVASVGAAGYETHVRSPAGEATAPCDLSAVAWLLEMAAEAIPANPDDWRAKGFDQALAEIECDRTKRKTDAEAFVWDPEAIGSALYRAVFVDRIQGLLDHSRGLAAASDGTLPIEIRIDLESPHEARLATLPWELLYDPERETFLAQSEETPIIRYLTFDGRVQRIRAPEVLRVLVVSSSPSDLVKLDGDAELATITGWQRADIVVDHLEQPGRQQLRGALRRGYHVLHFLGHGAFDAVLGEGSLALVDKEGQADQVPGPELARWITNHRSLRLVVLNACSAGNNAGPEPFAGVASALVRGGVAAAIAMRRAIPDGLAVAFARVLYERLAAGRPLDAALSSARQELSILAPGKSDWATPIFFAHSHDVFHVPENLREALTRIFSWLGVVTSTIAANAWSWSQGGPQIPGLGFYDVNEESVPIFGVLLVVPLLVPLLLVLLRYQAGIRERGLFHRLPVAFKVPIGGSRRLARYYQAMLFFVLVAMPVFSQIQFQKLIFEGSVWTCEKKPEGGKRRVEFVEEWHHHFTKATSPTVLFEHKYFFGPKRTTSCEKNPECEEQKEKICDVTFFPFWQPLIFLLADIYIWILFVAVLWGIWANEPLSRIVRRSLGRRLSS